MIISQYLVSDIIRAKHQVLRSDTTEVRSIFNLDMISSVRSRPSAAFAANWHCGGRLGLQQLVSV